MKTEIEEEVRVEIEKSAVRNDVVVLNVVKVWGMLEVHHKGNMLSGGMTWVPDGTLPVTIPTTGNELTKEECTTLFKDVIGVLMPSVKFFVNYIDDKDSDF